MAETMKIPGYILKFRWIIISVVLILTVYLGFQIPKVGINSDVISSLPSDDKHAVLLKKIGAQFGGNRVGMVILECENVFTPEVLNHVNLLTDSIKQLEGISSVTSLVNAMEITSTEEGLQIGKLVDEENLPTSSEELNNLKQRVLSNEMYKGVIVSEDGTATLLIFTLYDSADIQKIAGDVRKKTLELNLPEKIYFAGSPMLITSISQLIAADLKLLFPIALLVIAFVLYLGLRSFRGVILPVIVCIISIVWVIGIMGLSGFEMSMVSNNIPIVLLAVGSAYTIHVIHRIDQTRETGGKDYIKIALAGVSVPVILAALTTVAGFLSFIFGSYLKMIRDFGLFTALGTFFALLLSLLFVPALVAVLPTSENKKVINAEPAQSSRLILSPLHRLLIRFPKQIVFVWILVAVFAIWGITMIERNVDVRNYFKKENPARVAEDIMTEKFGGTKPVFVYFKGDIQSPEVLNTMLRMEEYMKKSPDIATTQSIAGLVAGINGAFSGEKKIPEEKEMVEQLWFLIDGNENIQKFVTPDLTEAIIISKFISSDNNAKIEFEKYIQQFIDKNDSPDCQIEVTGMPFIDVTMDRSLINSQIRSLLLAVIFVIIIVSLTFRSLLLGIYATSTIVVSILILFGFMGFTGIPLNIATVLVASIAVGIGIDYSIHVTSEFKHAIALGKSTASSIESMLKVSGKAIIVNVFSVSAGFLVLLFSEMVPLEYFGLLIALSMIGSGLGALTLLPAILIISNREKPEIVSI